MDEIRIKKNRKESVCLQKLKVYCIMKLKIRKSH